MQRLHSCLLPQLEPVRPQTVPSLELYNQRFTRKGGGFSRVMFTSSDAFTDVFNGALPIAIYLLDQSVCRTQFVHVILNNALKI